MIERYTPEEIGKIWTDENKFQRWLDTELAVIKVREEEGIYPQGTYEAIKNEITFTVERIKEIEKTTHHDLMAFVMNVCENISGYLRKFVHKNITSYDTEEPAQARIVLLSLDLIIESLEELNLSLIKRAKEFRYQKIVGRTHAKKAQITILGRYFLLYADRIQYVLKKLADAGNDMKYSKLSGAIGCYNRDLTPEDESAILKELGLGKSSELCGNQGNINC